MAINSDNKLIPGLKFDTTLFVNNLGYVSTHFTNNKITGVSQVIDATLEDVLHLVGHPFESTAHLLTDGILKSTEEVNACIKELSQRETSSHLVRVNDRLFGVIIDSKGETRIAGVVRYVIPETQLDGYYNAIKISNDKNWDFCNSQDFQLSELISGGAIVGVIGIGGFFFLPTNICDVEEEPELILILEKGLFVIENSTLVWHHLNTSFRIGGESIGSSSEALAIGNCIVSSRGGCLRCKNGFELFGSGSAIKSSEDFLEFSTSLSSNECKRLGLKECMDFETNVENESKDEEIEKLSTSIRFKRHQNVYQVLNFQQIVKQMQDSIEKVKNVIDLPLTTIRTLLKHFKWDSQVLLEKLFDGDQEELFKEVGIVYSEESLESTPQKRNRLEVRLESDSAKSANCMICYAEVDVKQLFSLNCDHLYCKECWNQYLTTKIISEGNVNAITCAETDCNVVVDDEQVVQLLNYNIVKAKYQRIIINSYVECNRLLRWCPKPDCLHAFSVKSCEAHVVVCICGTQICFSCGQSNHEPIDCDLLRKWNKRCAEIDDKDTTNWIITNTKECPKCRNIIEKSDGCNHMICGSINCKHEFCWFCLKKWQKHDFLKCNNFNEDKLIEIKSKQSSVHKVLEKFTFYWNRFKTYERDLQSENELQSTVTSKMLQMQNKLKKRWVDIKTSLDQLKRAVGILSSCRQTIMYSYVFTYLNQKSLQLHIFEANLRDLQKSVESLSHYLKQEMNNEKDFKSVESNVLSLMNYCRKRRYALIDHISEGNDKQWWNSSETEPVKSDENKEHKSEQMPNKEPLSVKSESELNVRSEDFELNNTPEIEDPKKSDENKAKDTQSQSNTESTSKKSETDSVRSDEMNEKSNPQKESPKTSDE